MRQRYVVNVEGFVTRDGLFLMTVRSADEAHAPGTLSVPGGKVEDAATANLILERTLAREIEEEVGVTVDDDMAYLESTSFMTDDGDPCVDVVFLCRYHAGEARPLDPAEVSSVRWMTADDILADPASPAWTRQSVVLAERRRRALGW